MKNANNKTITSSKLAKLVKGELRASPDLLISGVAEPDHCSSGDVILIKKNPALFVEAMKKATLVIFPPNVEVPPSVPAIITENPDKAFIAVLSFFDPYDETPSTHHGIHPSAVIGKEVTMAAGVQMGENSVVGDHSYIHSNVVIGKNVSIGKNAVIHPGVVIYDNTIIGDDVLIKANTVIGGKGFGYIQADGIHHTVPQIGRVRIGNHVDIGACCCIDRATLGETLVEDWVKIDNLCQIAHNVVLKRAAIIISQVGISGSSSVGENSILAGQVGLADHVHVGKNVLVGAQSGVNKSIPDGEAWFGYPARPMMRAKRIEAVISKLPELYKDIDKIISGVKNNE